MMPLLLTLLAVAAILFFLLLSSFESFSRIALAKFIKSLEGKRRFSFDFVARYDLALVCLKTFVFFLQALLLLLGAHYMHGLLGHPWWAMLSVTAAFLIVFQLILYPLAYVYRESLLNALLLLFPVAWYMFLPINKMYTLIMKEESAEERERSGEDDDISEEQLEIFFEEGTKEGVIAAEDQEMIESVLEFGDTLVKEIMTPRVDMDYVRINTPLPDIVSYIVARKHSRYPVIADRIDNVEGVILAKDVFNYWDKPQFDINEILRPSFFVPETMRILELLKEMQKSKQKFAIVIDEFGGVSGVVTMEDIMEEIVGDIKDEYDDDSEAIVAEKNHFLVRGDTDIYELSEKLEIELDETEDYQTVAGLLSFRLGKIPQLGDRVEIGRYVFEVLDVDKNRIRKVKAYGVEDDAKGGQS